MRLGGRRQDLSEITDRRPPNIGDRHSDPNRGYGCLNFGPFLADPADG